jgi:hypothetical protein
LGGTYGDNNQGVHGDGCSNGDGRRDFWSYESPFSRRVKEKLREAHVSNSEASRGPSNQAVDLLVSDEDAGRYGLPETLGADLISCLIVGLKMTLDVRMSVSFTEDVEYQGCSFSTYILREPARDQASPCAHHQAKIIDGAKKPQCGIRARICDGESEDVRRSRFDREKRLDLKIECDAAR